jgi:NADH:ubiquinone oxidoreductase subunit 4 (subunit M)
LINALIPIGFLISMMHGEYKLPLICWGAKTLSDLLVAGKGVYTFKRADLLLMFPFWEIIQIPYTIFIGLAGTLRGFTWKGRQH